MEIAEFCSHALMSLEVVIHSRALPLDGLPSLSNQFPESNSLTNQKYNTPNVNKSSGIGHAGDDLCNTWLAKADVPSINEIQRTSDTTSPFQETKRLKIGNDLATVISPSFQKDHTYMVASENIGQANVPAKGPETTEESPGHASDKDALAPRDGNREVVSETLERESFGKSDDDSVLSLQPDDYLSSESDIES